MCRRRMPGIITSRKVQSMYGDNFMDNAHKKARQRMALQHKRGTIGKIKEYQNQGTRTGQPSMHMDYISLRGTGLSDAMLFSRPPYPSLWPPR